MKQNENVLLAEFLNLPKVHCNLENTTYYKMHEIVGNPHSLAKWYEPENLQFHKNMEWLIPVVEKVKEIIPNTSELDNYLEIEDKNLIFHFCIDAIKNN